MNPDDTQPDGWHAFVASLPREMRCDCGAAPRGCCPNCCKGCSTDTPGAKGEENYDAAADR